MFSKEQIEKARQARETKSVLSVEVDKTFIPRGALTMLDSFGMDGGKARRKKAYHYSIFYASK